jgi:hypothetical protein
MLVRFNKIIQKFRLRYLLYTVLLNFFFFSTLTASATKPDSANKSDDLATINVAENYSITFALNLKKVERHNFEESSEYKSIHYSKYFFIDSKFLPQHISFSYSANIQVFITQYELIYNHLDLRSPPSYTA